MNAHSPSKFCVRENARDFFIFLEHDMSFWNTTCLFFIFLEHDMSGFLE